MQEELGNLSHVSQLEAVEDQALVDAALVDHGAYRFIVRRYEAALRRYVGRLLGSSAQAVEDVLQEVFLKTYMNLNDYDGGRPFGPWIYRIAYNEAVSHLRKNNTQPKAINGAEGQLILEQLADEAIGHDLLEAGERDSRLRQALNSLEARYRDVLVLRYLEDKSYDDISDILEMPPGTVATRIQRGLKQLRSAIGTTGKDGWI